MPEGRTSQGGLIVVGEVAPEGRASQAGLIVVGEIAPTGNVSQAGLILVAAVQPTSKVSQAGLIVVGWGSPCSARRCQLWIIRRKDGEVLRFTSHDEPVTYGADTYTPCNSLNETASEAASVAGDVGNIELFGILSDEAISEADLYAGLYDDAFIEVWEISWDDPTDIVRRIAAGWAGNVSHGEDGFRTEVLGPGARMLQKPLLQIVAPGCGWVFGDPDTCAVDIEARKVAGAAVTAVAGRAFFLCDAVDPANGSQWDRGKVIWLTGDNAGTTCEVKVVDFGTGGIVLWDPAGFMPQVGDTFDLFPGCDLAFDGGCTVYANKDRFGGFPHVPGSDAVSQTPDAKE